jgi:glycosyltransferase involved in cell wall biosynthesis
VIKISAVLSIHNRSRLFKRALESYLWQTMPRTDWEIILLDDMSTEDLSQTYQHLKGQINLRHIMVDHRKHPIWKERNPNGTTGDFENWFHTPAITINMGAALAQGDIICLCHPEIMHAPWNFVNVWNRMQAGYAFLFGRTWLGTPAHNAWMNSLTLWSGFGWKGFLEQLKHLAPLPSFAPNELYWYTSFIPRKAFEVIGGVDFEYLNGVAAEDDDFRDRAKLAGCIPTYFPEAEGLHQDHSDEMESHHRRDTQVWRDALERNRKVYFNRKEKKAFPNPANQKYDWRALECMVGESGIKVNG